jgi:hypothetical protein
MEMAVEVGDLSTQQPKGSLGSSNSKLKCEQYQIITNKGGADFPHFFFVARP